MGRMFSLGWDVQWTATTKCFPTKSQIAFADPRSKRDSNTFNGSKAFFEVVGNDFLSHFIHLSFHAKPQFVLIYQSQTYIERQMDHRSLCSLLHKSWMNIHWQSVGQMEGNIITNEKWCFAWCIFGGSFHAMEWIKMLHIPGDIWDVLDAWPLPSPHSVWS